MPLLVVAREGEQEECKQHDQRDRARGSGGLRGHRGKPDAPERQKDPALPSLRRSPPKSLAREMRHGQLPAFLVAHNDTRSAAINRPGPTNWFRRSSRASLGATTSHSTQSTAATARIAPAVAFAEYQACSELSAALVRNP